MSDQVSILRSLPAVRERSNKVFELAQQGKTEYFRYNADKESAVVDFTLEIIHRDFGTNYASIPGHSRWRHFDATSSPPATLPRITTLLSRWASSSQNPSGPVPTGSSPAPSVPAIEAARRLVDLFIVSVLLDAGAGPRWTYEERSTGMRLGRSEGLAIASLDMFINGAFTKEGEDNEDLRCQADAAGLAAISPETLAMAMQVHPEENPMEGLDGRAGLLSRLGTTLEADDKGYFCGPEGLNSDRSKRRPGFLVDYLLHHPTTQSTPSPTGEQVTVLVSTLWDVLISGLSPIWPASRTTLNGASLGDVWPCGALARSLGKPESDSETFVAFHKLTQWMCYSVMEPIEQTLGWTFHGGDHQTGLPEYRNGGLFIDLGVLEPTPALLAASTPPVASQTLGELPRFEPSHPAIIEWRALTVALLDRTAQGIRDRLGLSKDQLTLKQVLEAATWKGGREIAKKLRPETGGPPINIISDGTVF